MEIVQLLIDAAGVLSAGVERLDIDDHDVDVGVGRKLLQMVELLGVVDEVPHAAAVLLKEMFRRDLERLRDALADRDGGYDHNEL